MQKYLVLMIAMLLSSRGNSQTGEGALLVERLGCAACHSGLPPTDIRSKAPDLSHAGMRYNPAYIFAYLQNPGRVRRHIGSARMPNFHLSEREALALALFLDTRRQIDPKWPILPPELQLREQKMSTPVEPLALLRQSRCLQCHKFNGDGEEIAPEMNTFGYRLNQQWLKEFLVSPQVYGVPESVMPGPFFETDLSGQRYVQIEPEAIPKIVLIAKFLAAQNTGERQRLEKAFAEARRKYPEIDAAQGQAIFRSQNCAACHRTLDVPTWPGDNAPNLSIEGQRVQRQWLHRFLQQPFPIRPFGFFPGSASRMPDFGLAPSEVELITDALMSARGDSAMPAFTPPSLSHFQMQKAGTLLRDKLPCLGCHQIGGQGGRIGPDLSSIVGRLQPDFIRRIIDHPEAAVGHQLMPRIEMPAATLDLIAGYLLALNAPQSPPAYADLLAAPLLFPVTRNEPERIFSTNCAPCHGAAGRSDGFNAAYLPVPPTQFADSSYLAQRPDDTLFDGIFAGGYILNKSQMMPAWGATLSNQQIEALVGYLRQLCRCEGPAWSRDGQ